MSHDVTITWSLLSGDTPVLRSNSTHASPVTDNKEADHLPTRRISDVTSPTLLDDDDDDDDDDSDMMEENKTRRVVKRDFTRVCNCVYVWVHGCCVCMWKWEWVGVCAKVWHLNAKSHWVNWFQILLKIPYQKCVAFNALKNIHSAKYRIYTH